jgi:hypothetical protein
MEPRSASLSDSDAAQKALEDGAAPQRVRSAIWDEVNRLAGDDSDREHMRAIREQLAELAPPRWA